MVSGRGRRGVRGNRGGRGRGGGMFHQQQQHQHQQQHIQTTYHHQQPHVATEWNQIQHQQNTQVLQPHHPDNQQQTMLLPGQVPTSTSSSSSRKILINPHFRGSQQQHQPAQTVPSTHVQQQYTDPRHQHYGSQPSYPAPATSVQPLMHHQPVQPSHHVVQQPPHVSFTSLSCFTEPENYM